jgi:uncharacterized membrane protein YhaH (DUF805 family)
MDVAMACRKNLSGLLDFSGRQSRKCFWPWFGVVFSVSLVILVIIILSITLTGLWNIQLREMASISGICIIFAVIMLSASITRRLHDLGISGVWAIIPLALLVASYGASFHSDVTFGERGGSDSMSLLTVIFLYDVSVVILIVFLAMPGGSGDNRFGSSVD